MMLTLVRYNINNILFFSLLVGVLRMLTFKYVSVERVLVLFHFGWSRRFMIRDIFNVKFLPFFCLFVCLFFCWFFLFCFFVCIILIDIFLFIYLFIFKFKYNFLTQIYYFSFLYCFYKRLM